MPTPPIYWNLAWICARSRWFRATQSLETTARYAHLTEVNRQQAKDRIEDLVAGFPLRWEEI